LVGLLDKHIKNIETRSELTKKHLNNQSQQLSASCHFIHSKLQILEVNLQRQINSVSKKRLDRLSSVLESLQNQKLRFESLFSEFWSADKTVSRRAFLKQFENLLLNTNILLQDLTPDLPNNSNCGSDPECHNPLSETTLKLLSSLSKLADQDWITNKSNARTSEILDDMVSGLSASSSSPKMPKDTTKSQKSLSSSRASLSAMERQTQINEFEEKFHEKHIIFAKITSINDFYIAVKQDVELFTKKINEYCENIFLTAPLLEDLQVHQQFFAYSRFVSMLTKCLTAS
jgi:hypothetical protein